MHTRRQGIAITELSAVVAALAILLSVAIASMSRARELSKRMVCSVNLKGIGASCRVYAQGNSRGDWPIPPFDGAVVGEPGEAIEYRGYSKDEACVPPQNGGGVAYDRYRPSRSIPPGASTQLSVTRAYWMLVRSGGVPVAQFICPSSDDEVDPTEDVELYYDFRCYENISYGYQVPFGPRPTHAHEGMDNRQVLAADKGPWYTALYTNWWPPGADHGVSLFDPPEAWRPYNSPNHGGSSNGEGQNCLRPDLHVSFELIPAVGIDHDNIYTKIEYNWGDPLARNLIHGELPGEFDPAPYPGQGALGETANDYAATDSLIYP